MFNQQQCFIYSTASFLSKLRAKKVEKWHNSSFYRKFRKWNTGIGFRYRERLFPVLPIMKKKKKKLSRPTDSRFFWHVTVNTHIFFLGLRARWNLSAQRSNSNTVWFLSCQIFVLPSTGFELTPLIHCSTNRLALCPVP